MRSANHRTEVFFYLFPEMGCVWGEMLFRMTFRERGLPTDVPFRFVCGDTICGESPSSAVSGVLTADNTPDRPRYQYTMFSW